MSLAGHSVMSYEDSPMSKTKKKDLMVFDDMTSIKVVRKLSYRHRVGLWATAAIVGWLLQFNIPHYVCFWYSVFFN